MLNGDCNICINGKMPSYSATCVECGLSRKNYKPITKADRIRAMSDEELANMWFSYLDCGECPMHRECNMLPQDCLRLALKWLKQEVKDD